MEFKWLYMIYGNCCIHIPKGKSIERVHLAHIYIVNHDRDHYDLVIVTVIIVCQSGAR